MVRLGSEAHIPPALGKLHLTPSHGSNPPRDFSLVARSVANPHRWEGLALRCAGILLIFELTLIAVATLHSAE